MRRFAAVLSVLVTGLTLLMSPPAAEAGTATPVIFVHGYKGGAWNWDAMIADFRRDGWPADRLVAMSYNVFQSNKTTAAELNTLVRDVRARTGAAQVDIVAHSMGSLSSRWYLKFLGGTGSVRNWVSMGGPNHGSSLTGFCSWAITSCAEMSRTSDFLATLNAGDETPGGVRYGTFWSSCDELVNPDDSVLLTGATNTHVGCVEHAWLLVSEDVSARVRSFVRG